MHHPSKEGNGTFILSALNAARIPGFGDIHGQIGYFLKVLCYRYLLSYKNLTL